MSSLAPGLIASTERVIPLEVERGYRDVVGAAHVVRFARRAPCSFCREAGCAMCSQVGWIVDQHTVSVAVPAGSVPGTRIRIDGGGDVLDSVARAIAIELAPRGDRADELRRANDDFEHKLMAAWNMDRASKIRSRRGRRVYAAAAITLLAFLVVAHWGLKGSAGARCETSDDCRSGDCIETRCTGTCRTDLDCPPDMACHAWHDGESACRIRR